MRGVLSGVFIVRRYALLTIENQRLAAIDVIIAAGDTEAIALAWRKACQRYCELWDGERLVAFIDDSLSVDNSTNVARPWSSAGLPQEEVHRPV